MREDRSDSGSPEELFSEEMQAFVYSRQLEAVSACAYVKGLSPRILYVFLCPRRLNSYQECFNRKGLVDADRTTTKKTFTVFRDFYVPFQA